MIWYNNQIKVISLLPLDHGKGAPALASVFYRAWSGPSLAMPLHKRQEGPRGRGHAHLELTHIPILLEFVPDTPHPDILGFEGFPMPSKTSFLGLSSKGGHRWYAIRPRGGWSGDVERARPWAGVGEEEAGSYKNSNFIWFTLRCIQLLGWDTSFPCYLLTEAITRGLYFELDSLIL